jgi:type III pantothenate kinase
MAWLLIDNSNTRTKLALGDADGLSDWRAVIPTADLSTNTLAAAITDIKYSGIVLASVVPGKAAVIGEFFDGRPFHQITCRSPLGYGFDINHPEQIGSDRLANTAALREKYGYPAIVVDFGTAITFSVLSADGNFSGGAIAPGMDSMTDYLSEKTAQLPRIAQAEPERAIGRTTVEAILSGAVFGHRGMVQGILRKLIAETGGTPGVVATGGGAEFGSKGVEEIVTLDPNLTLEGLRLVAAEVFV